MQRLANRPRCPALKNPAFLSANDTQKISSVYKQLGRSHKLVSSVNDLSIGSLVNSTSGFADVVSMGPLRTHVQMPETRHRDCGQKDRRIGIKPETEMGSTILYREAQARNLTYVEEDTTMIYTSVINLHG